MGPAAGVPPSVDVAIVGGGIVGLATALPLLEQLPELRALFEGRATSLPGR